MVITDSQQELLTEVDEYNNVIGPISRGIAHKSPNKYYRCIAVLVFDERKQLLIQKRSSTKDLYPNCWDISVGGHVGYGSSYIDTAIKELAEELGIKSGIKDLVDKGEVMVTLPESHEYFNVFEYHLKQHDNIKISKSEINNVKWMPFQEVREIIVKQPTDWYGRPIQIINQVYN